MKLAFFVICIILLSTTIQSRKGGKGKNKNKGKGGNQLKKFSNTRLFGQSLCDTESTIDNCWNKCKQSATCVASTYAALETLSAYKACCLFDRNSYFSNTNPSISYGWNTYAYVKARIKNFNGEIALNYKFGKYYKTMNSPIFYNCYLQCLSEKQCFGISVYPLNAQANQELSCYFHKKGKASASNNWFTISKTTITVK